MAYSEILLSHFYSPKNNRVLMNADAVGIAGIPGNGPFMIIYLAVHDRKITQATFQSHGCAPSIAAGSFLATELEGTDLLEAAARWSAEAIERALGGLPDHKRHCARLAAEAVQRALSSARKE